MLGGTDVAVSGTQFMIREDDDIRCIFGGIEVRGVYVNEREALCISPLLSQTGRLPFQILVSGSISFSGESTFTSCKSRIMFKEHCIANIIKLKFQSLYFLFVVSFTRAYEVYIANNDLVLSSETIVRVQWSPHSIFPMEAPGNYLVDIDLLEMNMTTGAWKKLASLERDLPNTGVANVRIPNIQEEDTLEGAISPVIIQVALSASSTNETRLAKRGIVSSLLGKLGRFALRTIKNAPMRFLKKLARQAVQRVLCEAWSFLQPPNIGQEILNRLPPCPRRVRDAEAQNSGFKEEKISSLIPVIGSVQDYFGTTLVDDAFRQYFHPNTASCFRQRVTDR